MGTNLIYECPKCKNQIGLNYGVGMLWHSFDKSMFYPPQKGSVGLNFYYEFDKEMLEEIHRFISETEDIIVPDVYYHPYICEKCGKVESKIYFRIEGKGKTFMPKYTCKCGGKYRKMTNKDESHLCCNKCGNEMKLKAEAMWD